ncbi:MAG: copper-binding protein [Burkholderiales bacterium]
MKRRSFPLGAVAFCLAMIGPASFAFAQATAMTDGEVRKVDKDASKVTIKHGPIANLDMPAMTMVFRVSDPAVLDQLKSGDKIRFSAEKVQGAYTVMKVEPAK